MTTECFDPGLMLIVPPPVTIENVVPVMPMLTFRYLFDVSRQLTSTTRSFVVPCATEEKSNDEALICSKTGFESLLDGFLSQAES